jgi:chitinase
MHFSTLIAGASAITLATASALPRHNDLSSRQAASGQTVVYWGQNGPDSAENDDLSTYCTATSGIDVLILAFLYEFGNGQNIPVGVIGESCSISTTGAGSLCDDLAAAITTCQDAGVTVLLSIGGASGAYSLQSQEEAETIGQYLWDSYANSGNTTVERPFGDAFVNGFDFDIEVNDGSSQYYQYMISTLRANFDSDPDNTYLITGAPQCPIPEPNMGIIIGNSTFDRLWVQWYNNNNGLDNNTYESCSLGFDGNAPFNFVQWAEWLADTPSADALLYIGAPASTLASDGTSEGEIYYITPAQLATLVAETEGNSSFGGVMLWDAGYSDDNVNDGCTYAQEAYSILLTGEVCDGAPISATSVPSATSTKTTATSTATSTGTITTSVPTTTATSTLTTTTSSTTTSSVSPSSTCLVSGGSCSSDGEYACSGSSFGICSNGAWVIEACPSGDVCVQDGSSLYCAASGSATPVCG